MFSFQEPFQINSSTIQNWPTETEQACEYDGETFDTIPIPRVIDFDPNKIVICHFAYIQLTEFNIPCLCIFGLAWNRTIASGLVLDPGPLHWLQERGWAPGECQTHTDTI